MKEKYCTDCGTKKVKVLDCQFYSSQTGKLVKIYRLVCPKKRWWNEPFGGHGGAGYLTSFGAA